MKIRPPELDGDQLFALVREYDALGFHRTATDVDVATRRWLRGHVPAHLTVEEVPYRFPRFVADTQLRVDDEPVDHLPLFYEATGEFDVRAPEVAAVDAVSNFVAPALPDVIDTAQRAGAGALVVATRSAFGQSLVALNRVPVTGSGLPVVLIAAKDEPRVRAAGNLRLRYRAEIVDGESANLVIQGGDHGPDVVVTTPLTGWFRCAGERGTGIALALDLASRLTEVARVTFLATTGHELEHVGARAWLDGPGASVRPDAVIHAGGSMATGAPADGFTGNLVMTKAPAEFDRAAAAIYATTDQRFVGRPERWSTEAREWLDRTERLVSMGGTFPRFHTVDDRPDVSTSPARLSDAAERLTAASVALLGPVAEGQS